MERSDAAAGHGFRFRLLDRVDAAEEVAQARAAEPVVLVGSAFFRLQQSGLAHDGEMLGNRGDVRAHKFCHLANAEFAARQRIRDQDARRMGQGFDDLRAGGGQLAGLGVSLHAWQNGQTIPDVKRE